MFRSPRLFPRPRPARRADVIRRLTGPALAVTCVFSAVVTRASAQPPAPARSSAATTSADDSVPVGASAGPNPVRPGDVLRLRVWRDPELSGDFPVDQWGAAVLPELGRWVVGGRPADAVEHDVAAKLLTFLNHRSVAVTVLRRVAIGGAVRNPGLYPLDPTVTLDAAITLAGGPTPEGRLDRLELVRDGVRQSVRLTPGLRLADSPVHSGDQLRVPERGWWSRNTVITTTLLSVVGSAIVLRAQQR